MINFKEFSEGLNHKHISLSHVDIDEIRSRLDAEGPGVFRRSLAESEIRYLDSLKVPKRTADYLAGRFAAKKAVSSFIKSRYGRHDAEEDIDVVRTETGEPAVAIDGLEDDVLLSISHSGIHALAIAADSREYRGIGIDIEYIEPRDDPFLRLAYNEREIHGLKELQGDSGLYSRKITEYWTVKEAVLKSMGIGLNVDLRHLSVSEAEGNHLLNMEGSVLERYKLYGSGTFNIETIEMDGYIITVSSLEK